MVTRSDYLKVARQLKAELAGTKQAFLRKPRVEITELIRDAIGEDGFRLKSAGSASLRDELLNQGVRVYPPLENTTTGDVVRLFHTGTVIASLVDMLARPSDETDRELADVTKKVKGVWEWER